MIHDSSGEMSRARGEMKRRQRTRHAPCVTTTTRSPQRGHHDNEVTTTTRSPARSGQRSASPLKKGVSRGVGCVAVGCAGLAGRRRSRIPYAYTKTQYQCAVVQCSAGPPPRYPGTGTGTGTGTAVPVYRHRRPRGEPGGPALVDQNLHRNANGQGPRAQNSRTDGRTCIGRYPIQITVPKLF